MLKKSEKNPVTKLSANWNNSSKAEGFYWNLNNDTSNRNRNISSHLVNANNVKYLRPATWQNIKIKNKLYK